MGKRLSRHELRGQRTSGASKAAQQDLSKMIAVASDIAMTYHIKTRQWEGDEEKMKQLKGFIRIELDKLRNTAWAKPV